MTMLNIIRNAQTLQSSIARDIAPLGGILRCTTCGQEEPLSEAQIGRYLASGWPKHCGYTMRWVTAKELAAESDTP